MKKNIQFIIFLCLGIFMLSGCDSNVNNEVTPIENNNIEIEKVSLDRQIVFEEDNIKVTAENIDYSDNGIILKFSVENNSSKDIAIVGKDFSINDLVTEKNLYIEVLANKKANESIEFYNIDLIDMKVSTIKDIEFNLNIFDKNNDNLLKEQIVNIKTNAKDYEQKYGDDGKILLNQNDVKVYVGEKTSDELLNQQSISFYIENNSKQEVTVLAYDVSVNDVMVGANFYTEIIGGKKSYTYLSLFEGDLKDNNISNIDKIEFKIRFIDTNSGKDIYSSDIITINY